MKYSWQDGTLTPFQWQEQVAYAIEVIKEGRIDKVVLARDITAVADDAIDSRVILRNLAAEYPSTWVF